MPEINWSKTHWNKQNIIRLALVAGIKYPNWGRKLLLKCMLWVKEKSNMEKLVTAAAGDDGAEADVAFNR